MAHDFDTGNSIVNDETENCPNCGDDIGSGANDRCPTCNWPDDNPDDEIEEQDE